ncbi:hypothetical protein Dda_0592 [Drechslerella dactyloides]|uniref:Uncharacterized protein n=1 Tax=Drechslerella dactyloides TaxID=74499 RepID=A0AAD6NM50_DREDA|nr:hypothetical protein Dda_0592 [Drechslerella dactyloides]
MATLLRAIKPSYLQSHVSGLPRYIHTRSLKAQTPLAVAFRTSPQKSRQFSSQGSPQRHNPQEVSHEMPKINWKELGASRTVKIVLIIALSIIGTMETIFYFKLFMRRFFPDKEVEEEGAFESPESSKST